MTVSGSHRLAGVTALALALAALAPGKAHQRADPNFDASVRVPAYTSTHPVVAIDEAHNNYHTALGRYEPLARLLRNDGYEVRAFASPFTSESLAGISVLVISNALGAGATVQSETSPAAFTVAECEAVVAWVAAGGALLLISDHTPMGEANAPLAARFSVTMGRGFVLAADAAHRDVTVTWLLFSRDNGLLGEHVILRGRSADERISVVRTFAGQSLSVPAGASPLLRLGDDAWEAPTRTELRAARADLAAARAPSDFTTTHATRVGGRVQGLALEAGRGRVVILGEAAMLSAQVTGADDSGPVGMNMPGSDDKQFALNVLHWLSRLI